MAKFNDLVRVYDNEKQRCSKIVRYIAFENGLHHVSNTILSLHLHMCSNSYGSLVNNAEIVHAVTIQNTVLYLSKHEILELKKQLNITVPF